MCRPHTSRCSDALACRIASSAAPVARGNPNLLSKIPVVVLECVCGSTLGEIRNKIDWFKLASLQSFSNRSSSWKLSTIIRPDPLVWIASFSSSVLLLFPWK